MAGAKTVFRALKSLLFPARPVSRVFFRARSSAFFSCCDCFLGTMDSSREVPLRTLAMNATILPDNSSRRPKKSHSTVTVEGNIGSGKAQLLNYFPPSRVWRWVLEEPIDLWRNKDGQNLLDLMYKDPKANSFTFQNYVLETMADLHERGLDKPVSVIERSFYSARYIFVENLKRNGLLTESEYQALDQQFRSYLTGRRNTDVDLILYLRTDPEIAHGRIMKRGRSEELSISVDYLRQLHDRYEDWLCNEAFPIPARVMVIDGNVSIEEVREQLRQRKDEILFGWGDEKSVEPAAKASPLRHEPLSPRKLAVA